MSDEILVIEEPAAVIEIISVGEQGPPGIAPKNNITNVTYDGQDRVTGYFLNGAEHVVTYPSATSIIDVGGGSTKTVTLDLSGRIVSISVT